MHIVKRNCNDYLEFVRIKSVVIRGRGAIGCDVRINITRSSFVEISRWQDALG